MRRWSVYGCYDRFACEMHHVGNYRWYWRALIAAWWFRNTRPPRWWLWFWYPAAQSRATTMIYGEAQ